MGKEENLCSESNPLSQAALRKIAEQRKRPVKWPYYAVTYIIRLQYLVLRGADCGDHKWVGVDSSDEGKDKRLAAVRVRPNRVRH